MKLIKFILLIVVLLTIPIFVSAYSVSLGSGVYPISISGVSYGVEMVGTNPDNTCDFWVAVGSSYIQTNQRELISYAGVGTYNLATLPVKFTVSSCNIASRTATFSLSQSTTTSCTQVWSCGGWSSCANGIQIRSCSDGCGSSKTETTTCTAQQTCSNECTNGGQRACYSGSSWRECGNYDTDTCLEYSSVNECPSTYRCTSGECFPTQNLCNPGNVCDGTKVYWQNADCGKTYQRDCADTPYITCSNGQCVSKCKSNSYIDCWNGNVYYYNDCNQPEIEKEHCSLGSTCDKNLGICVKSCQSRYSKKCYYDDVYWFDSCSNPEVIAEDCNTNQRCSEDKCVEKTTSIGQSYSTPTPGTSTSGCTNECSSGTKQCSGNGYQTCGNYDSDSCTEWSSVANCLSGQTCSEGKCQVTSQQSENQINEETTQQKCNFFTRLFGCKEESEQEVKNDETEKSSIKEIPNTKEIVVENDNLLPVIFVHGHNGDESAFSEIENEMGSLFTPLGVVRPSDDYSKCGNKLGTWGKSISVRTTYYDPDSSSDISTYAKRLEKVVNLVLFCSGAEKVNIVAHSMGGLVARGYIQNGNDNKVNKLIMLGTPNRGVYNFIDIGCGSSLLISSYENEENQQFFKDRECNDMKPNSDFLIQLNSNEAYGSTNYITIASDEKSSPTFSVSQPTYTFVGKGDGVVRADSVKLRNADNVKNYITNCCSSSFLFKCHEDLLKPSKCPQIYENIVKMLKDEPVTEKKGFFNFNLIMSVFPWTK